MTCRAQERENQNPDIRVQRGTVCASRAKIQAFLKQAGAQLWIEHDIATHARLPLAPKYVE